MEETISFEDLGLNEETLAAVAAKGFEQPSPIQVLAIPRLLNGDANIIAKARTGTGKTAAFGIPLVQTIKEDKGKVCALVLTPTRELALQVSKEIDSLHSSKFPRIASVYGGAGMGEQLRALRRGVEIVVGTPGRVKDHLERGSLNIANIDYFILDEADEMLDMGFIEDIEEIFSQANPNSRVLLFSATMPQPILNIASRFMGDYEIVEEEARPEEPVLTEQRYWVVRESEKINALVRLIDISEDFYGLIFTQTKADADMVTKELDDRGYQAAALHGDIAQIQREKIAALVENEGFRAVEVLWPVLAEDAAGEADDVPAHVDDREHEAAAEGVVEAGVLPLAQQPRVGHLEIVVALGVHGLAQAVPAVRREADAEVFRGRGADAAPGHVVPGGLPRGGVQLLVEEAGRVAVQGQHPGAPAGLGVVFLLGQGHARAAGKEFHRLREAQVLDLHDEVDDPAALAAAEAVIDLLVRRDGEGRRLLAVEGAEAEHVGSALFPEPHIAGHDVHDVVSLHELRDELFGILQ